MTGLRADVIGAACSRPSRPLRAAFGGGLRPALTAAARGAAAMGSSGRRDGPGRSNKGTLWFGSPSGFGEELRGIEILIAAPQGVEGVQQLAHQGDDGLQLGLAARNQASDEGAGRGAAARRGERGKEQRLAQPLVAAPADPRLAPEA